MSPVIVTNATTDERLRDQPSAWVTEEALHRSSACLFQGKKGRSARSQSAIAGL